VIKEGKGATDMFFVAWRQKAVVLAVLGSSGESGSFWIHLHIYEGSGNYHFNMVYENV
jgi:hypothetical protein